ncbi:ribonuclease P protein subunit p38 [Pogoniulus pusillus]|uniref:ribonuclease P protein subunit p38 n=1 Tax=Pogoniulus pusillus TaxID=488313 RepID=UPI0030B99E4E
MAAVEKGRAVLRKEKKASVKTCLDNPFVLQWKPIDGEDMRFILHTLEERIKHIGLKKVETPRRKKHSPGKSQAEGHCDASGAEQPGEEAPGSRRQAAGWTDIGIRRQLAIGVNEVTKALERNQLLLLLVCKSASPALLTTHLIQLSASRATPAGQVPRLSQTLAPLLGLASTLALGFKKQADAFSEAVEAIIPRIPALEVPWFQGTSQEPLAQLQSDSSEDEEPKQLAAASGDELPSQKRKHTASLQPQLAHVVLQPLKIQKLVPNPNRVKKPPRRRKKASLA